MEQISYLVAFTAGLLVFLSPCILPLIPAYLSYLTGVSFNESSSDNTKKRKRQIMILTIFHALSFIIGFSIVFVALGASLTLLGSLLYEYQPIIKKVGGILIIFFSLMIMGVIKLPFLQKEAKFSYKRESVSFISSFIVGAVFAAAWTPCVGPILGSILVYASSTASIKTGIKLLTVFSIGLAIPFFLAALAMNSLLAYIEKVKKYLRVINVVAGSILLIFGVLLIFGR